MMTVSIVNGSTVQRGAIRPRVACFRRFLTCNARIDTMLVLAGLLLAHVATAQSPTGNDVAFYEGHLPRSSEGEIATSGLGDRMLRWVNGQDGAFVTGWMQSADATFYPMTFASVPVYWGVSVLADEIPSEDALAFTAGWAVTAGSTILLKRLVGRKRPYVSREDLVMRYKAYDLSSLGDFSSFPSGHSSMSVFLANYLAIETNTPTVRITSGLWAASVAASRVWNGVHFPSDVLAGAVLGSGVALLTHHLR